uniref:Uncharacterized protein n=1 Tax=Moumouvirus sp. 'Monve' TaxID=1128131 RepID=H2EFV2_9VIRU|nr:hypothetical protein mv_R802 [Moumouvirus Monve]
MSDYFFDKKYILLFIN